MVANDQRPSSSSEHVALSLEAREFLLEEQRQRRAEIEALQERMESDQRTGLVGTGALWGWLLTNSQSVQGGYEWLAAIIGVVVPGFFLYRHNGLSTSVHKIAEYTRSLERAFCVPDELGWETHVTRLRQAGKGLGALGFRARVFWIALAVVNGTVGILYVMF